MMQRFDRADYDVVVVGSGPNGLAAAIAMQQRGLSVLVLEAKKDIGGGMRSAELTLPGYIHDICSAVHPMAADSPFFSKLPLDKFGLEYMLPEVSAAHPLDGGRAALLVGDVGKTAAGLGADGDVYRRLMDPLVRDWPSISADVLGPLHYPKDPLAMARFGLKALRPASALASRFKTEEARALVAGMAAHSMLPLSSVTTSAIALVLMMTGHRKGWPVPRGGTMNLANALAGYFLSLGGTIETGVEITSFSQLPSSQAVMLDMSPRQLLQLGGHTWSPLYQKQLEKYRYGMGVFKVDWALDGPIPWTAEAVRKAGTVHLGNSYEEIAASEALTARGGIPEKPYILIAQQSVVDASRAPAGKHTVWAYCHVPNGSVVDMTATIERQIERYAPGFRDRILAKHVMDTRQMEAYNPNYVGGDINGGAIDLGQLFTRPALRSSPYRTSTKGIYICSASTPPGGGVHGMCGFYAATRAMKDVFRM